MPRAPKAKAVEEEVKEEVVEETHDTASPEVFEEAEVTSDEEVKEETKAPAKAVAGKASKNVAYAATGRFEVLHIGNDFIVINPSGQKVGTFDNDSKAAEFALRSNHMVGIK